MRLRHAANPVTSDEDLDERGDDLRDALSNGDFTTMLDLMELSGLADELEGHEITVLAPSESAFSDLNADELSALITDPSSAEDLLRRHIIDGLYTFDELVGLAEVSTLRRDVARLVHWRLGHGRWRNAVWARRGRSRRLVGQVATSVDDSLLLTNEALAAVDDSITVTASIVNTVRDGMGSEQLDDVAGLLDRYTSTTADAQSLAATSRDDLAQSARLTRWLLVLLAVVFAVGQIVPIWLGLALLRDDSTATFASSRTG